MKFAIFSANAAGITADARHRQETVKIAPDVIVRGSVLSSPEDVAADDSCDMQPAIHACSRP